MKLGKFSARKGNNYYYQCQLDGSADLKSCHGTNIYWPKLEMCMKSLFRDEALSTDVESLLDEPVLGRNVQLGISTHNILYWVSPGTICTSSLISFY